MKKYNLYFDKKQVTKLQASFWLIKINDMNLYFSYDTLVGVNNYVTNEKYSVTTSKHVNKHLDAKLKAKTYLSVTPDTLNRMAESLQDFQKIDLNLKLNSNLIARPKTKQIKI